MIRRGNSHVLFSDYELMLRIKKPVTLLLLRQMQELYEVRVRRLAWTGVSDTKHIEQQELQEYLRLLVICNKWMGPIIRIDFGEENAKNRQGADADGDGMDGEQAIKLSEVERRRARRQRRKNNRHGV